MKIASEFLLVFNSVILLFLFPDIYLGLSWVPFSLQSIYAAPWTDSLSYAHATTTTTSSPTKSIYSILLSLVQCDACAYVISVTEYKIEWCGKFELNLIYMCWVCWNHLTIKIGRFNFVRWLILFVNACHSNEFDWKLVTMLQWTRSMLLKEQWTLKSSIWRYDWSV